MRRTSDGLLLGHRVEPVATPRMATTSRRSGQPRHGRRRAPRGPRGRRSNRLGSNRHGDGRPARQRLVEQHRADAGRREAGLMGSRCRADHGPASRGHRHRSSPQREAGGGWIHVKHVRARRQGQRPMLVGQAPRSRRRTRLRVTATPTRPRDGPRDRGGRRVRRAAEGSLSKSVTLSGPLRSAPTSSAELRHGTTGHGVGSGRQPERDPSATGPQDGAPGPRGHPMAEAVPLGPLPGVGLIGALHSRVLLDRRLPSRPRSPWRLVCSIACTSMRVMSSGTLLHRLLTAPAQPFGRGKRGSRGSQGRGRPGQRQGALWIPLLPRPREAGGTCRLPSWDRHVHGVSSTAPPGAPRPVFHTCGWELWTSGAPIGTADPP